MRPLKGANDVELDGDNFNDLRLPPIKGSRALIVGSICFRLGLNLTSYNRYLVTYSAQTKIAEGEAAVEVSYIYFLAYIA